MKVLFQCKVALSYFRTTIYWNNIPPHQKKKKTNPTKTPQNTLSPAQLYKNEDYAHFIISQLE